MSEQTISYDELTTPSSDFQPTSHLESTPLENDQVKNTSTFDVNAAILRATAEPDHHGLSVNEIITKIKARNYKINQFYRIQENVGMQTTTLEFKKEYESGYRCYTRRHSVKRIRYCFILGLFGVLAFNFAELDELNLNTDDLDDLAILCLRIISYGVMIPSLFISIFLTFWEKANPYVEYYSLSTFILCGLGFIVKKQLFQRSGPILPLVILLIPLFGICRFRFLLSTIVGWFIVGCYTVISLIYAPDSSVQIFYQTVNYVISLLGGMAGLYGEEILRRRNYALRLPFDGSTDDEVYQLFRDDHFKKRELLYLSTLSFKNKIVENIFNRNWYLIDTSPFEHPNAGDLHKGVFRTIRFAVYVLILNQLVLSFQDNRYLWISRYNDATSKDEKVDTYILCIVLRFGCIIPVYLAQAVVMYILGRTFYRRWLRQSEEYHHPSSIPQISNNDDMESQQRPFGIQEKETCSLSTSEKLFHENVANNMYVRKAQMFASFVIVAHGTATGVLFIRTTSVLGSSAESVYLMGFLNALLFAHQSGFKVRFIFAAAGTSLVSLTFIIAMFLVNEGNAERFTCYTLAVLILGMMSSYELECLRRTFFVLRSIRMLEFDEWFNTVLKIQGWVRNKLKKKLKEVKNKLHDSNSNPSSRNVSILINTSQHIVLASKFGLAAQVVSLIIAFVTAFL